MKRANQKCSHGFILKAEGSGYTEKLFPHEEVTSPSDWRDFFDGLQGDALLQIHEMVIIGSGTNFRYPG